MKKTQLLDALRNIWKQKISFLSIVVIAALGVTLFLGIDFSASAIRKNASVFYNEKNYRDVELVSTLLLSEDDLAAIRGTEGVRDVEGVYVTDAKASANDARMDVEVTSLTERIDLPILYEGRLPVSAAECAVEQKVAEALELHIGDTVIITDAKGGTAQYLTGREFVVCGIVVHPDHVCGNVPATPYIIVTRDAFDAEQLEGCFMKAEIVTDRASDAARYDGAYLGPVGTVLARLEELGTTRAAIRDAGIRTQAEDALDENRQKLGDAEQELADARAELDRGRAELEDGERQYSEGERELIDARAELDEAKQQLLDGWAELEAARAELDEAKAELDAAKEELDAAKKKLDSARRQLVAGWDQLEDAKEKIRSELRGAVEAAADDGSADSIKWAKKKRAEPDSRKATAKEFWITESYRVMLDSSKTLREQAAEFARSDEIPDEVLHNVFYSAYPDGEYNEATARALLTAALVAASEAYEDDYKQLAGACDQWDRSHRKYLNGKAEYNAGLAEYEEGLAAYTDGEERYAGELQKYEDAKQAYSDGEAQYDQGVQDLAAAREQLEDAMRELTDGEARYADGLRQLDEGKAELAEAEEQLAALKPCQWIALDVTGNASYILLRDASGNLQNMERTFALMFVLVGALVIYATISKMVDEQRTMVGTTKALGFFNREVFVKYLLFGVSAAVLGVVLGLVSALTWAQSFLLNGYNTYYVIDLQQRTIAPLPTVIAFAAGILLAVAAVWFATRKLMNESAIRLMQPAVPKGAKTASSGRKPVLSLYSRLILKNIRTDLRRVAVTVVSVAGCCALVVIGITLKQSVNGAELKQFSEVYRLDGWVRFDPDADPAATEAVGSCLSAAGAEYVPAAYAYATVRFDHIELYELFCGDLSGIREQYALTDAKTGVPLEMKDDGVYVTKRFSEIYGVHAGDTFEIALNGTEIAEVSVAGVFNSYTDRYLFMSSACYRALFGRDAVPNMFLVKLCGADEEALTAALRSAPGFESYRSVEEERELYESGTSALNAMMLLFIGMAGVMAGVVLMNLTNIYILQKKRELTVMRINGFTVKEVIGYVLRETVLTTAIGIVLGVGFGAVIGYRFVRTVEQGVMQFDRSVSLPAWLIGAAITVVFTVIVNVIALRKVRRLKLTDV